MVSLDAASRYLAEVFDGSGLVYSLPRDMCSIVFLGLGLCDRYLEYCASLIHLGNLANDGSGKHLSAEDEARSRRAAIHLQYEVVILLGNCLATCYLASEFSALVMTPRE